MTNWRYSINYGPEGEANYANVYAADGQFVGNLRTHHAIAVVEAMNAATSALENGPAGLADATNNPASPSLSSLRKGAEVVAWRYRYIRSGVPAPWMVTTRVEDTMGIDVESEPLFSAALVSGSREDGDGTA